MVRSKQPTHSADRRYEWRQATSDPMSAHGWCNCRIQVIHRGGEVPASVEDGAWSVDGTRFFSIAHKRLTMLRQATVTCSS